MSTVLGMTLSDYEFGCVSEVADKDGSGDVSVKELIRIVARGDKSERHFENRMTRRCDGPQTLLYIALTHPSLLYLIMRTTRKSTAA